MATKNKRSLENAGKRERANAAKASNARERNIAKHYLNAGPNIINLARAAYHWYNSVPWLGGQNENGLILQTGEAPAPGMRSPKAIVKGLKFITKTNAAKITPEQWTAAQDAAIARGDIAEAQRLRNLHFTAKAPETKQRTPMFNASGESTFNEFNGGKTGLNWFSESEKYAANHGVPRAFYINEPDIYFGNVPAWIKRTPADERYIQSLRKLGYTEEQITQKVQSINEATSSSAPAAKSVGMGSNNEFVTRNNNTIKSANAITYDDKGVRIPLGERDNFNLNDIRYALTPFIVGGTGYGIYNRAKKRNGGSNNIGSYKRSIENAGTIADYIDAIYSNNPKEEFLGEPEHHYDFTQSEEWANAHGYYPDKRGHRDDRVKKPTHPSHPSRGTWEGNNFILTNKGLSDPNYIFFGLNDGGQDPQAILKYKDTYVIPEFTVTPKGNYINNSYDNIRLHFKNGGVHYKVKKGDTLSKIAKSYTGNVLRYDEIAKESNIKNPDRLEIGQDIIIPQQFLDTIKYTNLPELVVTGNKKNTLINKLKIKAPNIKHEEIPNSLRVKKQNLNNSTQSTQSKTFIDDIIQNAINLYQQGTNYIVRQYEKNVGDKDSASTLKIPSKTKLNKAYNIIPKSYTGDTIKIDKNKYIIPESINLNDVKLGTRNRGSREQLNTEGAIITNFDPYIPYDKIDKKNNTTTYMGIDKNGNFKVGTIDNFNSGDLLTKTYSNDVESFVKDDKGNQLFKPASGNNRSRNVPIINVIENGKIKRGSLNILSNKKSKNSNTYGTITGGRVILEAGNERRLVSGSLNDIEKQFNDIKKRHGVKTVRMYTLDNGTYNRALRTKNRIISASDLQAYDNLNSSGGSFMYLLNNKNFSTDTLTNETDYEKLIKYLSKSKRRY